MRRSVLFVLSLMLVASMLLAACGTAAPPPAATQAPAQKTVLNVWSFTNEIRTMAIAFEGKHPDVDVVYTMIPMTNGEYQTKLKAAVGTADVPDVVARVLWIGAEHAAEDIAGVSNQVLGIAQAGGESELEQGKGITGYGEHSDRRGGKDQAPAALGKITGELLRQDATPGHAKDVHLLVTELHEDMRDQIAQVVHSIRQQGPRRAARAGNVEGDDLGAFQLFCKWLECFDGAANTIHKQ